MPFHMGKSGDESSPPRSNGDAQAQSGRVSIGCRNSISSKDD